MLIRKEYRGCSRLYWEPEDPETEAPQATYEFRGQTYKLEFDGRVDDLIRERLRDANCAAVDIAELFEVVPMVESARSQLASGRKVSFRLSTGANWEAVQRTSGKGDSIILRTSYLGQTATLSRGSDEAVRSLTLRTEGRGITHEIKAEPGRDGRLRAIAEAVTVYHQSA
ncbi:MAG: hypothetical protein KC800_04040 [Candidatus Eremiobacteraeota bacterium]|nr:hypothetical protein [Candidatus Eremiobacteraeota bacterium]